MLNTRVVISDNNFKMSQRNCVPSTHSGTLDRKTFIMTYLEMKIIQAAHFDTIEYAKTQTKLDVDKSSY